MHALNVFAVAWNVVACSVVACSVVACSVCMYSFVCCGMQCMHALNILLWPAKYLCTRFVVTCRVCMY